MNQIDRNSTRPQILLLILLMLLLSKGDVKPVVQDNWSHTVDIIALGVCIGALVCFQWVWGSLNLPAGLWFQSVRCHINGRISFQVWHAQPHFEHVYYLFTCGPYLYINRTEGEHNEGRSFWFSIFYLLFLQVCFTITTGLWFMQKSW